MSLFESASLSDWTTYLARLDFLLILMLVIAISILALNRRRALAAHPPAIPPLQSFWFTLLVLAVFLRVPLLQDPLWYDEAFSLALAQIEDQTTFITALLSDVHPPGYYTVLRSTLQSESASWLGVAAALRLPALLAGLAFIGVMYRLTWHLSGGNRTAAQIMALLVAVLPGSIYYSTEARYPMLLALGAAGALLSVLEKRKVWYVLAAGFLPWWHWVGYLYTGLIGLAGIYRYRREWLLPVGGSLLLCMPLLSLMLAQSADVSDGFWLPLQFPLWHLIDMTTTRGATALWMIPFIYVPVLLGVMLSLLWLRRNPVKVNAQAWHIWALLAVGVPALAWGISLVWEPVYLSRSLLFPAILLLVPLAMYLSRMRHVLTAGLLIAVLLSLLNLYITPRTDQGDMFAHCDGADHVYTTQTNIAILAKHYTDLPVTTWRDANNMHQWLSHDAKEAMGIAWGSVHDLAGEICVVAQLDYYTSNPERMHLEFISRRYRPTIYRHETNDLIRHVVMRFRHD